MPSSDSSRTWWPTPEDAYFLSLAGTDGHLSGFALVCRWLQEEKAARPCTADSGAHHHNSATGAAATGAIRDCQSHSRYYDPSAANDGSWTEALAFASQANYGDKRDATPPSEHYYRKEDPGRCAHAVGPNDYCESDSTGSRREHRTALA